MARIYAHKRGKASSTKPVRTASPSWVRYSAEEVVKLVAKLAKEGNQTSEIGMILRDQYGIPNAKLLCGKSISALLKEAKLSGEYPEDLLNLMSKAVKMRKHLEHAKEDEHSRKGLHNTDMKILRLVKYYKRTGVLPEDWVYDPKTAAIIVSGR